MKNRKILSVFAVFTAVGMVLSGCDTGLSEAALEEASDSVNPARDTELVPVNFKKIDVKFVVCNGGWGLVQSGGIVSTADDNYLL